MARITAAAHPAVGHFNANVSQFRPVALGTFDDNIIQDDTAADAGAEREEDHALAAATGPDPILAVCGGVGVVLERGQPARGVLHVLPHWDVLPGPQVRRVN